MRAWMGGWAMAWEEVALLSTVALTSENMPTLNLSTVPNNTASTFWAARETK